MEDAAEEQMAGDGDENVYYMCVGTSIMTHTMEKNLAMPFCMSGVLWTFAAGRRDEGLMHGSDAASRPGAEGEEPATLVAVLADEVQRKCSAAVRFWRKAPENFPGTLRVSTEGLLRKLIHILISLV